MTNLGRQPARLVVQSDRRLGREALAAYLNQGQGFVVVGHTDTAPGLRTLCALGRPDLGLIDIEALTTRTVRFLCDIRTSFPSVDLVVSYTSLSLELLADAVRAGVTSFVPSSRGLIAVVQLLRQRARRAHTRMPELTAQHGLTDRELGVISLLSSGHTVADIARLLRISPHTVDNHKRRVYAKFGVDSQSLAVSRAVALGLVDPLKPDCEPRPVLPGQPPLALVIGAGPTHDRVVRALVSRGLPFVEVDGARPLTQDHWAQWHRGPVITVLVEPFGRDWLLPHRPTGPLIIVKSSSLDVSMLAEALGNGVRGLVHAVAVPDDLPDVIGLVARGYLTVGGEHAGKLTEWLSVRRHSDHGTGLPQLTAREQDILGLLARGQTIRQTARSLGIAAKTVENTQARLYRKLGTRNRAETLTVAYRLGLLASVESD